MIFIKDSSSRKLECHDFLGQCEGKLANIVSASHGKKTLHLTDMFGQKIYVGKKESTVTIVCDKVGSSGELYKIKGWFFQKQTVLFVRIQWNQSELSANNLDKKDFFGKSDPYIIISRELADGTWKEVYRTEIIDKNLNPRWNVFEISSDKLCNNDRQLSLRFQVFDHDNDTEWVLYDFTRRTHSN